MSFERLLNRLAAELPPSPDKPEETTGATARALWFAAAGQPRSVQRAGEGELPELDADATQRLETLVARRLHGEPLAYLTGLQSFLDLEFLARPGALIPRIETELLGREALKLLGPVAASVARPRVLDLCTGCGNLAIAMATRFPNAEIHAADLEAAALEVAAENARHLGVADRVTFHQGDLYGAIAESPTQRFEFITANPPYLTSKHANNMPVEVGAAEPVAAFDGGPFGISITLRLIRETPQFLLPGGWLCFELGAGQGPMIEKRLRDNGAYSTVHSVADSAGVVRALFARLA